MCKSKVRMHVKRKQKKFIKYGSNTSFLKLRNRSFFFPLVAIWFTIFPLRKWVFWFGKEKGEEKKNQPKEKEERFGNNKSHHMHIQFNSGLNKREKIPLKRECLSSEQGWIHPLILVGRNRQIGISLIN